MRVISFIVMFGRRKAEEEEPPPRRASRAGDRSWSSRIAWLTLMGGAAVLVTRMSLATVVEVHGDGMAPTLVDGDHVVIARDAWNLERGDIALYDPGAVAPHWWQPDVSEQTSPFGGMPGGGPPDVRRSPQGELRNAGIQTAMVDAEELDSNWRTVQARSEGIASVDRGPLRLGRVLAIPGDTVTFHGHEGALGLSVNGTALPHKVAAPIRIRLEEAEDTHPRMRALAYESTQERRYPVLVRAEAELPAWDGMELPPASMGPVEMDAPGYLVVADNRDGGECCDSRALGWLPEDAVRGRVVVRLTGDPGATPDLDPSARGVLWKP